METLMTLDKIKQEFIRYMEEVRSGEPYAKNFMGGLVSIIVEPEPISQERIMELTGNSQGTVSLTLQKLQLLMPIRTTRKIGDRKHYYIYNGSPERFILDLWQKRIEAQILDMKQLEAMIEKMKDKADRNAAFERFFNYLKNLNLYHKLVHELRSKGISKFEQSIDSGSLESLSLKDSGALEKGRLAEFLGHLRITSMKDIESPPKDKSLNEYTRTKNDYYSGIKTNLNPLYSQMVANQMMVIHEVFVEGTVTQEQIEKSTLLPRSTISEILSQSVKIGIVRVSKKGSSRIKLYQPAISFSDLMLSNYDQVARHISQVMPRLTEFIELTKKMRPKSVETKWFLKILIGFEKAYSFTRDFSNSMKVEMVIRMKEEYDRGFVFI